MLIILKEKTVILPHPYGLTAEAARAIRVTPAQRKFKVSGYQQLWDKDLTG